MAYVELYSDENMSVLYPTYLDDPFLSSDQEQEMEGENDQVGESDQDSGIDYTSYFDNVIANQEVLSEQIDNLNTNVCTLNDNVNFLTTIVFVLLFAEMIKFVSLILNKVLGLSQV